MTSLFKAATERLPVDATGRDSPEDRLTEIFAAVLKRAPEAARTLVWEWIERRPEGDVQVRTQRPTPSGGWIDLELRFRDPRSGELTLVWVEIKLDSGESGPDQLWKYACDLSKQLEEGEVADARLVFLTRPEDWSEVWHRHQRERPGLWPPYDPTWPRTSAALSRWAREANEDLFQKKLVQEFVDYLEDEHVASEGLTLEGAIVLQRFQETDEAFATLLEDTETRLSQLNRLENHARSPRRRGRPAWVDYFRTYTPIGGDPRFGNESAVLEWNFRRRPPRRDRFCFAAGLTWLGPRERAPWREADMDGWPEGLEKFEEDDCHRLYRWLQPEELAVVGALDDQVDSLTRWISDTFESLMSGWPLT